MKRVYEILVCLLLVLSFVSCGLLESSGTKEIMETTTATEQTMAVSTAETTETRETTETTDTTETTETTTEEPPKPEKPETRIEKTECFSHNGVVVTAVSYEHDDIWGDGIKFLIENNSEKAYSVRLEEAIVNDCMMPSLFVADVAAGKKAYETLDFSESALQNAAIDKVEQVELYFYLFDEATFERVYMAPVVTIRTNLYGEAMKNRPESGVLLYEKEGIQIKGSHLEKEGFLGSEIILYIENNGEKPVTITADDVSVNGFMVSALMSETVYPAKYAMENITILKSDLEENGITDIETVELVFRIRTGNDFMNTVTTEPIIIHFQ